MNNPIVSVIVPTYNVEKYLNRCIDSIIDQTFSDFECIIIDDGSTDNSGKIADEYATKDNRIKVIHKSNGGLTSARKAGFDIAIGEYICFPDSDDYLEPDYLKELYFNFKENIDIVIGSFRNNDNNIVKNIIYNSELIEKKDFVTDFILPSTYKLKSDKKSFSDFVWLRMYRKNIISDKCFVSEREVFTEDLFFQYYALLNARNVKIIDKIIYNYISNDNSLVSRYRPTKWQMVNNRLEKIIRYYNENNIPLTVERINGLIMTNINGCLLNSILLNNSKDFKKQCIDIKNKYYDFFITNELPKFNSRNKFLYFCLKYNLFYILFIILKNK